MSVTRKELRREVGKRLGDFMLLTATADGSETIFRDSHRLLGPNNTYRGRSIYPTDGTAANIGELRRVLSSEQSGGVLNVTPEWDDPTVTGDEAELWGVHGQGWSPLEVNDELSSVLRDASRNAYLTITADVDDTYDNFDGYFTLPDTITFGIADVLYETPNGDWISVDRASNRGSSGYWVTRGSREVVIGGDHWGRALDGMSLRVVGYGTMPGFTDDDNTTDITAEFLVWETCYRLLISGFERNPDRNQRIMGLVEREAKIARQRATMRPLPDWQRV